MRKRTFYQTMKRQNIVNEALAATRDARETLDPGLLESARKAISQAMRNCQEKTTDAVPANHVPVDKKKNLTIVMKYLALCPDNKRLHQEVRSFLTKQ